LYTNEAAGQHVIPAFFLFYVSKVILHLMPSGMKYMAKYAKLYCSIKKGRLAQKFPYLEQLLLENKMHILIHIIIFLIGLII
jgi:hypothetical protein